MKKRNVILEHNSISCTKEYMKQHNITETTEKDFCKIEKEASVSRQIYEESLIDALNIILNKMKLHDSKIELLKYSDLNDRKKFYEDTFKIIKMMDKYIIGENRYIYHDRDRFWNERYELFKDGDYVDGAINLYFSLLESNVIIRDFKDFFEFGKLIEPEQIETEEERQTYKEKLDNALKSYY